MKRLQIVGVALVYFLLLTISIVRGQIGPNSNHLMLYEANRLPGKYVLCAYFPASGDYTSIVVIGDTFSVQPHGGMYWVVMTNAYVFKTNLGSSTNQVSQMQIWVDVYKFPFPDHMKIAFHNSLCELSKIDVLNQTNVTTFEGEDALRQMKKMGLPPPDDMDTNAVK